MYIGISTTERTMKRMSKHSTHAYCNINSIVSIGSGGVWNLTYLRVMNYKHSEKRGREREEI
jgi:hypothetical protein